jgi:hypothetical protein
MMPPQTYSLSFDGYWREENYVGIPKDSGVFCVYACYYHPQEMTESIRSLIYIGEAEDVSDRIATHEKWSDWRRHLQRGEQVCFNFAPVESSDRERVEAALIFHHKPPVNSDYKDSFPFDDTTISTSGKTKHLDTRFTAQRTHTK